MAVPNMAFLHGLVMTLIRKIHPSHAQETTKEEMEFCPPNHPICAHLVSKRSNQPRRPTVTNHFIN